MICFCEIADLMTIKGFWKELNENYSIGQRRVSFDHWIKNFFVENGRFPRIGIDFYQFLFEALPVDSTFPIARPEIKSVLTVLLNKVYTLIGFNISFVFVFDGNLSRGKLRNEGRIPKDVDFSTQYQMEHQALADGDHFVRHPLIIEIKKVFDILNIKYITAPSDGEIELARINASCEIDAVISNDADLFIYGGTCLLRNFSKSEKDLPSSSANLTSQSRYFVTPITMIFLNSIGINRESMYFIAITAGDDYSNGWKGLGIHRSFALSNIKLPYSTALKAIYVDTTGNNYIKGLPPYDLHERIRRMNILISNLNDEIAKNGKLIFGRVWNTTIPNCTDIPIEVDGPNDFNIMIHFYPLCANLLFKFQPFSLNAGPLTEIINKIPIIPQLGSIIASEQFCLRRGTERDLSMGHTNFETNEFVSGRVVNTYTIDNWFKPEFSILKSLHNLKANNPDALLLSKITKSFLFRIIMYMDSLKLDHDDIIITQQKSSGESFARRTFEDDMYRITYKPEKCMGPLLEIQLTDENGISLKDKIEHEWIPKYILQTHKNGVYLIDRYDTTMQEKTSKKSTPRSKRGTPKNSPQKTNLFMLTKSPFKLIGRSKSDLGSNSALDMKFDLTSLDFTKLETVDTNLLGKRFKDTPLVGGSPKKKSKLTITRGKSISDVFKNQPQPANELSVTNFDAFDEDDEVSRILGDDSYIGEIPNNDDVEKDEDDIRFEKRVNIELKSYTEVISLDDSFSDGTDIPIDVEAPIEKDRNSAESENEGSDLSWERGFSKFLTSANYVDESGIVLDSDSDVETINDDDISRTPTKTPKVLKNTLKLGVILENSNEVLIAETLKETKDFNVSVSSEENLMSMFD